MSQLNQPTQIGQNTSPQGGRRMTIDERIQKNEDLGLDEDDSDDGDSKPEKRTGRRKIKIEFIEDKSRRHITFSKRKAGIMKKAYELSTLTGTQVLLLVVSETGLVYTFTTPKLQPLVTKPEGKNLIQSCLNAPDVPSASAEPPSPQPRSSASQGAPSSAPYSETTAPVDNSGDSLYSDDRKIHNPNNNAYQMNMSYGQYPPMPPNYMTTPQYTQYPPSQPNEGQMYPQSHSQQQQYNIGAGQYWNSPGGTSKGIEKK
ncbi:unnamed protein product [Umbelopsis ramanniana]